LQAWGGDVRAEETADAALSTASDEGDEAMIDALADAAYAENLGPVPSSGGRSKKAKVRPGTAPRA
jgi:hypothetical protein